MSSPKPDAARDRRGAEWPSVGAMPAHLTGRLTPVAMDRARTECDAMAGSITLGGLTRDQIMAVDFGRAARGLLQAGLVKRLRALLGHQR